MINLEKSISETDERAGAHVVRPGDDGCDSVIDRVETCCSRSINMSKSIHLKHVDVDLIGDHQHQRVLSS